MRFVWNESGGESGIAPFVWCPCRKDSAWRKHAVKFCNERFRIRDVLEHVVCEHKISETRFDRPNKIWTDLAIFIQKWISMCCAINVDPDDMTPSAT